MKLITQRIVLLICGLPFLILLVAVGGETISGFAGNQTNEPQGLMVMLTIILALAVTACWSMIAYKKQLSRNVFLLYGVITVAAITILISAWR
jgi:hypothetical protein